jgi:hypothetical protein
MLGKPFFITALCFHERRVEDGFRIWKAAKNVLNKRTPDKGRTSRLGARRGTHNTAVNINLLRYAEKSIGVA